MKTKVLLLIAISFLAINGFSQVPVITTQPENTNGCDGGTSILTCDGDNIIGYQWQEGTTNISNGGFYSGVTTNSLTISGLPMTTNFRCMVYSSTDTVYSNTVTLFINANPMIMASVDMSMICNGDIVTLTGSGGISYVWSPATGLDGTTGSPNASPTVTTTYTVIGTSANGCTGTDDVEIEVLPEIFLSIDATSPVETDETCTYSCTASGGAGGFSYNWSSTGNNGTGPYTESWSTAGSYFFTVTVTDANACSIEETQEIIVNPTSTFTLPSEVCSEASATITYTGSATPAGNYTWDFDGGSIVSGSGQGPYQISWNTTGVKNVSVQVIEGGTFSSVTTINSITVLPLPVASFTASSPVDIGINSTITYTGEISTSDTYSWDFDGATSNPTGAGPHDVNWTTSGLKTLVMTITNDNSCTSHQASQEVAVIPTSTFSVPAHTCIEANTTISYTGSATPASDYTWDFDGGNIVSGSGQGPYQIVWNSLGVKTITLQVVEDGVCTSIVTTNTLEVMPLPVPSFTVTPAVLTEENSLITYTGETSTSDTYNWNFDGANSNPAGIGPHNVNWNTGGLKTISVIVTNDNGCISYQVDETVAVTPISDFTAPFEVCAESYATISYSATSTPLATYTWDFDGATTNPTGQGPHLVSWNTAGTKSITLTVAENGYTSSLTTVEVIVNPLPISNMVADQDICNLQTGDITAPIVSGTPPYYYSWSNGGTTQTITVDYADTDYTLTVTDSKGCITNDQIHTSIFYVYEDQEICLITVDPAVGKNVVVWEAIPDVGTASYYIYKEMTATIWNWLGSVSINDETVFTDWSSVPQSHGDKYKITAVDTCGNESEMSFFHKTMNLGLSNVGSTMYLDWSDYEDESGNYIPEQYYIFRGTNTANMILHDSISSSFTSWNDINVFDVYFYMVGVSKTSSCSTGGTKGLYANAFSNQKDNEDIIIGLREINPDFGKFQIYPNPFDKNTTIEFSNPSNSSYDLIVRDITGKIVKQQTNITGSSMTLNRDDLSSGYYTVELSCSRCAMAGKEGENSFRGKVIIK